MVSEKKFNPKNGYAYLLGVFFILALGVLCFVFAPKSGLPIWVLNLTGVVLCITFLLLLCGFFVINPNESRVMVFFGKYNGTVKDFGFFWANPFYMKKKVSLRARNLNGEVIKVNDAVGNPIEIAAVVVWQVNDTSKAIFEVDDYVRYVTIQSEAAIRNLAGALPYDNFEDEDAEVTLRASTDKVNEILEDELEKRLAMAGIQIIEARISHLAYASEIASAMLQRQQASAVVAARYKIVEGAVSMVQMALDQLKEDKIVELDEERKAAMVSNMLVVLCSDRSAAPVVNAGTLHH